MRIHHYNPLVRTRGSQRPTGWRSLLAVLILFMHGLPALGLTCLLFYVSQTRDAIADVTDVTCYEEMRTRWAGRDPNLTSYFPDHVPSDVNEVRFLYHPRFLESHARFELGYTLTPDRIEQLYETCSSNRITEPVEIQQPVTFIYKPNSDRPRFPEDFECIILDRTTDPFDHHHGYTHGVAISRQRNEVIYWAEDW